MKVFIKNKLISWGGSSEVVNEKKEPMFTVRGKFFTLTKKKRMYDVEGNLLYIIRNRYWNFLSHKVFIYDAEKNKVATIKKGKWSLNAKYQIEDCVDDMSIEGKFWGRTCKILRNGKEVGVIVKDFTLLKDSFTLDAEEKDINFFTALVIALDNITDKRDRRFD